MESSNIIGYESTLLSVLSLTRLLEDEDDLMALRKIAAKLILKRSESGFSIDVSEECPPTKRQIGCHNSAYHILVRQASEYFHAAHGLYINNDYYYFYEYEEDKPYYSIRQYDFDTLIETCYREKLQEKRNNFQVVRAILHRKERNEVWREMISLYDASFLGVLISEYEFILKTITP